MFKPSLYCAAAFAVLALPMMARAEVKPGAAAVHHGRDVQDLSQGDWRFKQGDQPGATDVSFDDSAWEKITVPHTWDHIGAYRTTRSPDSNHTQGIGFYRLHLHAAAAARGRRQYLDFAGVGEIADVWVNGVHVGQHRGAFSRFRFDVTDQWKPGADNVVVVKADNSKPTAKSSTADILPIQGDFFVYGGVYRGVSLVTTAPESIDLLDFGGPGVYVSTPAVATDRAQVRVLTRLRSAEAKARTLTADITLRDAAGAVVARVSKPVRLAPGHAEVVADLTIAKPHLWNGTEDPYLYSASVSLLDGKQAVDAVEQAFGIRTFRFDPSEGFFLNGHHIQLHGVSRHQDREGRGWALSPADHAEDMALIKEIGANTVRLAHYEHADAWVNAADKAGMVAWAEVPYVSAGSFDGSEGTPAIFQNAEQQLKELIHQDYNHPAIVMWSVGNEVNASQIYMTGGKPSHPLKLLQDLNGLAKSEDPTRPTTFADCCEDSPLGIKNQQALAGATDLIGYNRYYGWYYGKPAELGPALDQLHAKHPEIPMSVTEYGAGGALSEHTDNILGANITAVGRVQPEAYQNWYHEESWKQLKARKYLYATWVWNMFDFASDSRAEGDSVDLNSKGLVEFDHKTQKDAFWFYKASWSKEPVVYLTDKRYVDRAYSVMTVKAYTNAGKARLTVNGVDKGEVACADSICLWPAVELAAGPNKAVVSAQIAGKTYSDETTWNGPAATSGVHIKTGDMLVQTIDGIPYGSDNFFTGGRTSGAGGGLFGTSSAPIDPHASTWRYGDDFKYAIPVRNGHWKVKVYTVDPPIGTTTPDTLMAIKVAGKDAVEPFNVLKAAGAKGKGTSKSFEVDVSNGVLDLEFAGTSGPAVVSSIDVTQ